MPHRAQYIALDAYKKREQVRHAGEVVVPVDDWVEAKDVIYRVGEELGCSNQTN